MSTTWYFFKFVYTNIISRQKSITWTAQQAGARQPVDDPDTSRSYQRYETDQNAQYVWAGTE